MTAKGYEVSFWSDENVMKLIIAMIMSVDTPTKTHLIISFKWVNCMVYELHLKVI